MGVGVRRLHPVADPGNNSLGIFLACTIQNPRVLSVVTPVTIFPVGFEHRVVNANLRIDEP